MGSYFGGFNSIVVFVLIVTSFSLLVDKMYSGKSDIIQQLSLINPMDTDAHRKVYVFNSSFMPYIDVSNKDIDFGVPISNEQKSRLQAKYDVFKLNSQGGLILDSEKLKTRNVFIDISGAGSAIVHAKKTLKVEVSGAGSVKYKGNPKVTKDISGAGSVKKL